MGVEAIDNRIQSGELYPQPSVNFVSDDAIIYTTTPTPDRTQTRFGKLLLANVGILLVSKLNTICSYM